MRLSEMIRYYSKPGVAQEIVRLAQNREIAVQYQDKFGKRPEILQFPADILNQVRKGATSFHASEERWLDPLKLGPDFPKREMDNLRVGWDLVLDIDCKTIEWSTICAELLLEALKWHDVNCASIKFSGGTGWHIGVPAEALSVEEKTAFPETAQIVAHYLKEFIRPHLRDRVLQLEQDLRKISEKSGKDAKLLIKNGEFDPYSIMEIDTILIAPRHLFRMPYSLNEKKWLVSVPIKPHQLKTFTTDMAKPENIQEISNYFLNSENIRSGEASQLLLQALDWNANLEVRENHKAAVKTFEFTEKVPTEAFPPCMKLILNGLPDGRKRSLFAMINFLRTASWPWEEIEQEIQTWNLKNNPPLKQGYIKSQLSWHKRQTKKMPPPNCRKFFEEIGVCKPDFTCNKIKNPISYPRFKMKK